MINDYYNWLLNRVGIKEADQKSYSYLFEDLFNREFEWFVERDKNRAIDGLDLRKEYEEETGDTVDEYSDCNMLEMIIALSIRCENDIMGVPDEDNTSHWFWDMIINMKLDKYKNSRYSARQVQSTLDNVIFRQYGKDGNGGLFPLKHSKNDQRNVEIWYQMASWLNENYNLTA